MTGLFGGVYRLATAAKARRCLAEEEATRDQLAALAFALLVLGRGSSHPPQPAADRRHGAAAEAALREDIAAAGRQWQSWLGRLPPEDIAPALGILVWLAQTYACTNDPDRVAETLLALDDAFLMDGPKTLVQEVMIDLSAEAMGVDLLLEGET